MKLIVADLESFWSPTHSLSKMDAMEYCLHPETELISLSLKVEKAPTKVVFGEWKIRELLDKTDVSDALVVAHNMSGFDSMVLAWRLGLKPKMWGCTLAMARPLHGITTGLSLAKLVAHYALGVKDNSALMQTRGKKLAEFTAAERERMAEYNAADSEQCHALFYKLLPHYNKKELWQIDATIRMLLEPKLILNRPLLVDTLKAEKQRKADALKELATLWDKDSVEEVKAELMSTPKLKAFLESRGVDVPMKPSPADPEKMTPAMAKTDQEFLALQEHEDELVALAVQTRLEVKSSILETRLESFLRVGKLMKGKLPVPLNYCGAETSGRWGGGIGGLNLQNMHRISHDKPKLSDALRNSIYAPPGYKLVVADLSGIEMRVNHTLWKVPSSMELFVKDPAKADLYRWFAAHKLYHKAEKDITKLERHTGKQAQLSLGFQSGAKTFKAFAKTVGGIDLTIDEAESIKQVWRDAYPQIVQGWATCGARLQAIYVGDLYPVDPWGFVTTCIDGFRLPSGRVIRYPALRQELDEKNRTQWVYGEGRHKSKIYAGKCVENCIAEDTLVLCDTGWKPIQHVLPTDRVHDGVEFTRHGGTVFKSVQACVTVDGVYMTPDHEVLADDGWKQALAVSRPYRPDVWPFDRNAPIPHRRKEMVLGVLMRMRERVYKTWQRRNEGVETGRSAKLWMCDETTHVRKEQDARHEQTPRLRRMARYVRQVQTAVTSSMEKLRCEGHNRLQAMATVVRELLVGHEGFIPDGAGLGPKKQRVYVLQAQLPLDNAACQHHEQAKHGSGSGRTGTESSHWNRRNNAVQPHSERMANGPVDGETGLQKPVYDIINCGPRQRFVVLGNSGPFIVHNCVQAIARDIFADNVRDVCKATGFRPVLTVHDEAVYVAPDSEADALLDEVLRVMRTPPEWWSQLAVYAEGSVGQCYGKLK